MSNQNYQKHTELINIDLLLNRSYLFDIPCEFDYGKQVSGICNMDVSSEKQQMDGSLAEDSILKDNIDQFRGVIRYPDINDTIASGRIVKQISFGPNSQIYKIWNEDLEIFRAVKLCVVSDVMHEILNRFTTEAKIAAQLRHPNIIEVYSTGKWNQAPYLEMELIDGLDVGQLIKQFGPLPAITASAISIMVCRALLYAHNQVFTIGGKVYKGIIHRDLKPVNIMISRNGTVKLLDFGIARPCDESLYQTVAFDKVVGTIQYLSPEQMDGSDLDFRTDIYSFGAVIYEMLSGQVTFPQTTLTSILKAKVTNSYKTFSELNVSIPKGLQSIVEKCLEFKKENRYSSLQEFLSALENFFYNESSINMEEEIERFAGSFKNVT